MPQTKFELMLDDTLTEERIIKDLEWAARERQRLRNKDAKKREERKAVKEAKKAAAEPPVAV
jgi:hypothetical protein